MSAVRDNSVLQDVSLNLRKFRLILREHSRGLVLFKCVDIYAFFSSVRVICVLSNRVYSSGYVIKYLIFQVR
jgi:hypothetical protein